ncbi:hypothetical protein SHELI_v1c06870 [Spiroplasma helicoides]|uniref:Lipoprotein n=1 Tax=Spiroplasma helicoides TaxID=216938 RepID=A0A1B3SL21_9MOLU|nr:lipoprotein [Spiroplasma helicoides]AOG60638.1 hypothetical protein SHELI_v1c06870 [Spiroplasma helicoides]
MKKLLNVLAASALISTSTVAVVSCSNRNFTEFQGWIANKESFVLYIGAKDCDYCNKFEDSLTMVKEYNGYDFIQSKFDSLLNEYTTILDTKEVEQEPLTDYGQKLSHSKIDFRQFVIDSKADNFNEKWSENLLKWVISQATEMYMNDEFSNQTNFDSWKQGYRNIAKEKTKSYFNSSSVKGTPLFLVIRNGKLVSWINGFEQSTPVDYEASLNTWFQNIRSDFLNPLIVKTNSKKITTAATDTDESSGSNSGGGSDGSSSGSGGSSSGGSSGESSGGSSSGSGGSGESSSSSSRLPSFDYSSINMNKYIK